MNKYFDSAIALTSICSVGLATLSFAEDTITYRQPETVKNIQLQRLDNSLADNLKTLEPVKPTKSKKLVSQPVSSTAVNLIKEFEGFEERAYIDTDGTPVIGYGLSRVQGKPVQLGDRISHQEANLALNSQLQTIKLELDRAINVDLSDRQLGAVASLSFNVGVDSIKNSTLVKKINRRDYAGAANEFLRWDKANVRGRLVQLPGLARRRAAEKQLFLQDS